MSYEQSPQAGLPLATPDIIEHDLDMLIIGGGMGACGAAYESVRWGDRHGLKMLMVDKAALERSGAVAQGLSAINTYLGDNSPEDYVRMVRTDLMGLVREDLIYDVGRHVDDSVHLFEDWGLPCWIKGEDGHNLDGAEARAAGKSLRKGDKPVRSGRWQIMINGESYKCIVAEAARKALGPERILERVFIVRLLTDKDDPGRIAGAVGFSVRRNEVHVFRAKAVLLAAGGAVNVYRPRSCGEGLGRAWYPVWNAGSTYAMSAQIGAEMTMMENRFVPARFKDGYGPVGAWFLLFRAKAVNALGEDYCETNKGMLRPYEERGYARGRVVPTCLRNHMMLREMREGRGPILMDTRTALRSTFATLDEKQQKALESEAWEDFLDMCVAQANLWASTNTAPEERGSEIMPTEPYLLGSHSGCCGIWVSGPDEDWVPAEYKIRAANGKVYNRMTTIEGLFTCGDGVGASGHKFSSGSHAEGRIAGKQMVRWCVDHAGEKPTPGADTAGPGRHDLCAVAHLPGLQGRQHRRRGEPPHADAPPLHAAAHEMHGRIRRRRLHLLHHLAGHARARFRAAGHAGGGLRASGRPRSARAPALLGELSPPLDRPPAHAAYGLPRGDPLPRLLLPQRPYAAG